MNRSRQIYQSHFKFLKNRGFTLVELMITLALSSLFFTAALSFILTTQQTFFSQDMDTRIQENARFAFGILKKDIRMAGYSNNPIVAPVAIFTQTCGDKVACTADTNEIYGDRLALSMLAANSADCLNTGVIRNTEIVNLYWVANNAANGAKTLYCRGYDVVAGNWLSTSQPLVDGIESMQVQYGVDRNSQGYVDSYLSASEITSLDNNGELASGWHSVRSVRLALLVSSGFKQSQSANDGGVVDALSYAKNYDKFNLLDGPTINPDDTRIRKIYTSVVALNNRF